MGMRLTTWMILGVCVFWATHPTAADELHLVNGNHISGKTLRMENRQLVFKTDFAGEITVDWQKVAKLITEAPIQVILKDGTTLEGATRETISNNMQLETRQLAEPAEFRLTDVKAINPVEEPDVKLTLRTNVGISQERGNTDTDSVHLDGEFVARTVKSRYLLKGELNSEKDSGDKTAENWLAYGKYSYFMSPKWFLYAFTQFDHDKFADLDLRATLGVGAGHQFFESERLNLYVGAGPAYVNEDYINAGDDDFTVAQWLISYDQYVFDKILQLFHNQTGYVEAADSSNWILKTRQGVRFPIYKGLRATFQYTYDYDNDPSPDAEEKWDSKLMFLLGWEFEN